MRIIAIILLFYSLRRAYSSFRDYGELNFKGINIINKKLDVITRLKEKLDRFSTPYIQSKLRSSFKVFLNDFEIKKKRIPFETLESKVIQRDCDQIPDHDDDDDTLDNLTELDSGGTESSANFFI